MLESPTMWKYAGAPTFTVIGTEIVGWKDQVALRYCCPAVQGVHVTSVVTGVVRVVPVDNVPLLISR